MEHYFEMRRLSVIHCWWESSGFVFCGFTPHCSLPQRTIFVHQLLHRYFNWRIYPCSCWRLYHFNIFQLYTRCWNWIKRFVMPKYLALHFVILFNDSFTLNCAKVSSILQSCESLVFEVGDCIKVFNYSGQYTLRTEVKVTKRIIIDALQVILQSCHTLFEEFQRDLCFL